MTGVAPFRLDGPLPTSRLAIEASAGTGKTFTLATLAARYVAERGVPVGELLIVTFTRAAAAELRDRVRSRLVDAADALAGDAPPDDRALASIWSTDRPQRLDRVRTAVADFDAATITTIHGFAQQVLGTLGSAVRTDPDAVLIDDTAATVRQVATDVLVAEAVRHDEPGDPLPALDVLVTATMLRLGNPDAAFVPSPGTDVASAAATRLASLVGRVADEVGDRRRAAGTLSFDDLLVVLRDALADPLGGADARRALRERYRVALIDEFQDTDPVQWHIFDAAFGGDAGAPGRPPTSLVLVGDPKQAIYAFRGANVHTYLQAAHSPGTQLAGLDTNWRSDPGALRASAALLDGTTFGSDDIAFHEVFAPDDHAGRVLRSVDGSRLPALSLRLAVGEHIPQAKAGTGFALAEGAPAVFDELAVHVRDLLETAVIPDPGDGAERQLRPDDVAVLVFAGHEGALVRDALRRIGIPAVITRGDGVLTSEAADHWHRLLAAIARPTDPRRARAAALTWFFGWDAHRLVDADDELAAVQEQLAGWGAALRDRGVAELIGQIRADTGVAARVLALPDGDRAMTDVDHIAELLTLALGRSASPATLLSTFEQLSGGNDDGEPEADLAARRVESESRAVQIMTTFVAKGLEFPVVCCPSLWKPRGATADANVWWDAEAGVRTIDLASAIPWGDDGDAEQRQQLAAAEAVGSNLRVLYVALTRARHHTAVWWLPTKDAWTTGLARVLFGRDATGAIDRDAFHAPRVTALDGPTSLARLAPVAAAAPDDVEVVAVDRPTTPTRRWRGVDPEPEITLDVAVLDRPLDRHRARWSFTAITARSHDGRPAYDPFDDALGDAADADEGVDSTTAVGGRHDPLAPTDDTDPRPPLPLGDIAGGAGFGTLVHEVLERVDLAAADLEAELAGHVEDRLAWNPWPVDRDQLVAGLAAAIRTPLGPRFAGRSLAGLSRRDRLDELDVDLTLGDGGRRATDADVGRLLLDHLPPDDRLRPWADQLAAGPFATVLAGSLTGSIDLVARVHHDDGTPRFVVCDYKTNRVAPTGRTPVAADFTADSLARAMAEHHYPLQALLYAVAVHRYLRWRQPGYDPATHLGGVGYLFVRGMVGPDTPTTGGVPDGLFDWSPPPDLVTFLSDLLGGRRHRGRAR